VLTTPFAAGKAVQSYSPGPHPCPLSSPSHAQSLVLSPHEAFSSKHSVEMRTWGEEMSSTKHMRNRCVPSQRRPKSGYRKDGKCWTRTSCISPHLILPLSSRLRRSRPKKPGLSVAAPSWCSIGQCKSYDSAASPKSRGLGPACICVRSM
jgi:hypothetical protein